MSEKVISTTTKKINERIDQLAACCEEIKTKVAANHPASDTEYIANYRYNLNIRIMEIAMGATYYQTTNRKGEMVRHLTFNAEKPTLNHIDAISKILTSFCDWEDAFLESHNPGWFTMAPVTTTSGESLAIDDNDTDIDGDIQIPGYSIKIDNIGTKKILEQLFGGSGSCADGASIRYLNESNLLELAAVGEKVSKHKKKVMWICIGAAALLTGGAVTGICLYNANKNKHDDDLDALPDSSTDDYTDSVDFDSDDINYGDVVPVSTDVVPVSMDIV